MRPARQSPRPRPSRRGPTRRPRSSRPRRTPDVPLSRPARSARRDRPAWRLRVCPDRRGRAPLHDPWGHSSIRPATRATTFRTPARFRPCVGHPKAAGKDRAAGRAVRHGGQGQRTAVPAPVCRAGDRTRHPEFEPARWAAARLRPRPDRPRRLLDPNRLLACRVGGARAAGADTAGAGGGAGRGGGGPGAGARGGGARPVPTPAPGARLRGSPSRPRCRPTSAMPTI